MKSLQLGCLLFICSVAFSNGQWPQRNVLSGRRQHSLYLWIWFDSSEDFRTCVRPFVDFQKLVLKVSRNMSDPQKAIWAGVGFGSNLYTSMMKDTEPFEYSMRQGDIGAFPDADGDVLVHAKSHDSGKLFQLTQKVLETIDENCIEKFEDTYSFIFRGCRDITGFVDGTANPKGKEKKEVVLNDMGGSFALAQRWDHKMDQLAALSTEQKEKFMGRDLRGGKELKTKIGCSHVAKMRASTDFEAKPKFKIYRQSQSIGTMHTDAGLFFLAFSESTKAFDTMLDAMVGADGSKEEDCLFHLSTCTAGNYFYFPGSKELNVLKQYCYL